MDARAFFAMEEKVGIRAEKKSTVYTPQLKQSNN